MMGTPKGKGVELNDKLEYVALHTDLPEPISEEVDYDRSSTAANAVTGAPAIAKSVALTHDFESTSYHLKLDKENEYARLKSPQQQGLEIRETSCPGKKKDGNGGNGNGGNGNGGNGNGGGDGVATPPSGPPVVTPSVLRSQQGVSSLSSSSPSGGKKCNVCWVELRDIEDRGVFMSKTDKTTIIRDAEETTSASTNTDPTSTGPVITGPVITTPALLSQQETGVFPPANGNGDNGEDNSESTNTKCKEPPKK